MRVNAVLLGTQQISTTQTCPREMQSNENLTSRHQWSCSLQLDGRVAVARARACSLKSKAVPVTARRFHVHRRGGIRIYAIAAPEMGTTEAVRRCRNHPGVVSAARYDLSNKSEAV